MAIKPITISFKNNEEDALLNSWIIGHSNYSGFIKDILKKEMSESKTLETKVNRVVESNLIEFDF